MMTKQINIDLDPIWLSILEQIANRLEKIVRSQSSSIDVFKELADHVRTVGDIQTLKLLDEFKKEYMKTLEYTKEIHEKHKELTQALYQNYGIDLNKN